MHADANEETDKQTVRLIAIDACASIHACIAELINYFVPNRQFSFDFVVFV